MKTLFRQYHLTLIVITGIIHVSMAIDAHAESSLLIQLSEQLNQETDDIKAGIAQLKNSSSHQKSANEWAKKLRALPKDSNDYAYARAQYAREIAADLEQKFETVTNLQHAAEAMTDTITRLIDAQSQLERKHKSLFNSGDSAESILAKSRQLKGLNNTFVELFRSAPFAHNPKLAQAYRVYQRQMKNIKLQSSLPNGSNVKRMRNLRDSSEAIAFLTRAYLEGLEYQARAVGVVSVGSEAELVSRRAQKVIANMSDTLNPNGQAMADMQMVLDGLNAPIDEDVQQIQPNPDLSNDIDAIAAKFIAQKQ